MTTSFRIGAFSLLLAGLTLSTGAQAQQAPAAPASAPATASRSTAYHAAAPEQRADKMSQELARQLNLDAATTAKVRAAALTRDQKIDAIQNGTTSNKEKNTALQANAQEFKAALQGILTPAQFAQYASQGGKHRAAKSSPAAPATNQ
ncbi:DUF4890 domain-containing protein [Hymenobacter baengnokdamensis]|uniref:DUF4890 domain-containing protein n=1 Tax=Hymenobacter baengnokdamensis TaxID=2615203 RepID=UPI001247886C|nr:DUF4890 domain-containing protein [Hymenobacter baengnokdamensis]